MISRDLLKRTPVRLAGAFTLLFALTVVALVAVLYLTLGAELDPTATHYAFQRSCGGATDVLSPWPVRPLLTLGATVP